MVKGKEQKEKQKQNKQAIDHDRTFFAKYPAADRFLTDEVPTDLNHDPAFVSAREMFKADYRKTLRILTNEQQFIDTENPIFAIQAFCAAHQKKVYPPLWLLEYLYSIFAQYLSLHGTESLDKIMELKRGPGKSTAFQEAMMQSRNDFLTLEAAKLRFLFNCSAEIAVKMVIAKLEDTPEVEFNPTSHKLPKVTFDWLIELYFKKYGKKQNELIRRAMEQTLDVHTPEQKKDFCKKYLENNYPERARALISKKKYSKSRDF